MAGKFKGSEVGCISTYVFAAVASSWAGEIASIEGGGFPNAA